MTALLASVSSPEEAALVAASGANIIDLKNPQNGALGALPVTTIRTIVNALNGVKPVSATIGDLPFVAEQISEPVIHTKESGVDIIKIGVFGDASNRDTLAFLARLAQKGSRFVLVYFAEDLPEKIDFAFLRTCGIYGVMIDTRNKHDGNLRAKISMERLEYFCQGARSSGLLCGLAGSLKATDIPALLTLQPDYLGFRGALCEDGKRSEVINERALKRIRQMIPEQAAVNELSVFGE